MHQRQAIRDAVIALLRGQTSVGDSVHKNVVIPKWRNRLPRIIVYTTDESVEEFTRAPRSLKRSLSLVIEIHVTSTDNDTLQDTLDNIAEEVENIMYVDHTLTGTCDDQMLEQVELDFRGEGDQPIAACRMVFIVEYITDTPSSSDDQTDLGNIQTLDGADVEFNIGHSNESPDEQVEAEDTINLEE